MIKLNAAKEVIQKHYHFKNDELIILDVILGVIIGNIIGGFNTPIWLFLIGASGAGKTSLLNFLKDNKLVYFLSNFTPNSFVSGFTKGKKKHFSLLPVINGKNLIIKDFTTVLSLNNDTRREIFSILRDVFDGNYSKSFGSEAGVVSYDSRFGLIGATTPAIDRFYTVDSDLGERFLKLRFEQKETTEMVFQSFENSTREPEITEEIQKAVFPCLNCKIPERINQIPFDNDSLKTKLMILSDLGAKLRSQVSRNGYTKEVEFLPVPEVGTRLVKQLSKLLYGIALVREKEAISNDEYNLGLRIIYDNLASNRAIILSFLTGSTDKSLSDISRYTKIPKPTASLALEDLILLNIIYEDSKIYHINENIMEMFESTGFKQYLLEKYEKNIYS